MHAARNNVSEHHSRHEMRRACLDQSIIACYDSHRDCNAEHEVSWGLGTLPGE